jgi:hypothetical protein
MKRRDFVRTMCSAGWRRSRCPSCSPTCGSPAASSSCSCAAVWTALPPSCPHGDPGYRVAARRDGVRGVGPRAARRHLRPRARTRAAAQFWDAANSRSSTRWRSRSGRAATSTARRSSRPARQADRIVRRLAQPVLQVMEGERSGIAVAAGMPRSLTGRVRGPDLVAHAARRRGRRVSRAARDAVPNDRTLAGRSRRRSSSRTWWARRRWPAVARAAAASPRSCRRPRASCGRDRAQRRRRRVQRLGHARQPGMAGGALDRLLGQLADGLVAFKTEMGPMPGRTRPSSS